MPSPPTEKLENALRRTLGHPKILTLLRAQSLFKIQSIRREDFPATFEGSVKEMAKF
jgi:hypothetical protein